MLANQKEHEHAASVELFPLRYITSPNKTFGLSILFATVYQKISRLLNFVLDSLCCITDTVK